MCRKALLLAVAMTLVVAGAMRADCPCLPVATSWSVTACETWTCAAGALVLAAGDPNVFTLPTSSEHFHWIVLRRAAGDGTIVVPEPPFQLEQFATMTDGSSRFGSIDQRQAPLLVTAPDGSVLVLSLRQPEARRRVVSH